MLLSKALSRFIFFSVVILITMSLGYTFPSQAASPVGSLAKKAISRCQRVLTFLTPTRWTKKKTLEKIPAEEPSQIVGLDRTIQQTIRETKSHQPRDPFFTNSGIQNLIASRPIYVSLTTSPKRIKQIHNVLETLDLRIVQKVLISIPMRFGRDNSTYEIPEDLKRNPKVQFIRTAHDLGPAQKLVPPTEYLQRLGIKATLITVDDDTAYPFSLLSELAVASALNPKMVIAGKGQDFEFWKMKYDKNLWPALSPEVQPRGLSDMSFEPKHVVEGFSGIAYPSDLVDTKLVRRWAALSKAAKTSDDLVINLSLALRGIPRFELHSGFFNFQQTLQFNYGFEEDALHRGAGLTESAANENINGIKYQKTYDDVSEAIQWPLGHVQIQ